MLLREAVRRVREAGFDIVNVDSTVIAQAPRLAPYVEAMRSHLAADLGLSPDRVNVKAKTSERLGHLGRGEGIAADAVCLLQSRQQE